MVQKIGRGGNEGGEGKEEKEEEEEEEKEEDEEEDEEEDKEDEEDEEDEQEEEDEAKRREEGRGGGGGSLSKISSEETLSKLRLKLNQNKAKSTKHAGRPADFTVEYPRNWIVSYHSPKKTKPKNLDDFLVYHHIAQKLAQQTSIFGMTSAGWRSKHGPAAIERPRHLDG